jgi:hypothetical protein
MARYGWAEHSPATIATIGAECAPVTGFTVLQFEKNDSYQDTASRRVATSMDKYRFSGCERSQGLKPVHL